MKKLFIALFFVVTLCSCKSTGLHSLYYWGDYENSYYNYYKKHTPESCGQLYNSYLAIVGHPESLKNPELSKYLEKTLRETVPPGMCAEYGYMLLNPETPDILKAYYSNPKNFTKQVWKVYENMDLEQAFAPEVLRERGLEMLQKEMELYPESIIFITPIYKTLSQQ